MLLGCKVYRFVMSTMAAWKRALGGAALAGVRDHLSSVQAAGEQLSGIDVSVKMAIFRVMVDPVGALLKRSPHNFCDGTPLLSIRGNRQWHRILVYRVKRSEHQSDTAPHVRPFVNLQLEL